LVIVGRGDPPERGLKALRLDLLAQAVIDAPGSASGRPGGHRRAFPCLRHRRALAGRRLDSRAEAVGRDGGRPVIADQRTVTARGMEAAEWLAPHSSAIRAASRGPSHRRARVNVRLRRARAHGLRRPRRGRSRRSHLGEPPTAPADARGHSRILRHDTLTGNLLPLRPREPGLVGIYGRRGRRPQEAGSHRQRPSLRGVHAAQALPSKHRGLEATARDHT